MGVNRLEAIEAEMEKLSVKLSEQAAASKLQMAALAEERNGLVEAARAEARAIDDNNKQQAATIFPAPVKGTASAGSVGGN